MAETVVHSTFTVWNVTRIIGVLIACYLWIHRLGSPDGILAAVATALLFLP